MPSLHIPDGYTLNSLIPAGDSHPETCIVYRPMLAAERRRLALQEAGVLGRRAQPRRVFDELHDPRGILDADADRQ